MTSPLWPVAMPYATEEIPGIGGRIKERAADFCVEELPAYGPCGDGEHLFLWIEKEDVSGEHLVRHLADALGIPSGSIGVAGIKDRRALTRQYVSVPQRCAARLGQVDREGIRLLRATPHRNKLRTGHLQGNRFRVVVRGLGSGATALAENTIAMLRQRGLPNFYGLQRFGHDGETFHMGMEILRGGPSPLLGRVPRGRQPALRRLALSAVQSLLFNQALGARMTRGLAGTIRAGDVMQVATSRGTYVATDVATEQARFSQRKVVPTGPMFGPKMRLATGEPGCEETQLLERAALDMAHFAAQGKLMLGTRRPYLIWPSDLQLEKQGDDALGLVFSLPAGSYATMLLRELQK